MDAVTITTAAARIVSTTLQVVQTCNEYYQKYKAVDLQLVCMQTQCSIIEVALMQIQDVIVHDSARFERLSRLLHENCGKPNWQVKVKVVWNDRESAMLLRNIEGQASPISLLLSAIQMKTHTELLGLLSKKESKSILKTASSDADTLSLAHENTAGFGLSDGESVITSMLDDKEFEFDTEIINTAAYRKVFNKARSKLPPTKGSQVLSPSRPGASRGVDTSEYVMLPPIKASVAIHSVIATQRNEYCSPRPITSSQDIDPHSVPLENSTKFAGDGIKYEVVLKDEPELTSKESEYRTRESSKPTIIGTRLRRKARFASEMDDCHRLAIASHLLNSQCNGSQSSSKSNSQDAPISGTIKAISHKPNTLGTKLLPSDLRGFAVLRGLSHPHIIRSHDTDDPSVVVLDFIPGGNLAKYVAAHPRLSEDFTQKSLAQIISAVGYLHRNGIVNPTLSCSKILLDCNQNAILTGFSNVQSFDIEYCPTLLRGELVEQICCTAEEASLRFYEARQADVWSCGAILVSTQYGSMISDANDLEWFMLTGDLAFDNRIANFPGYDAWLDHVVDTWYWTLFIHYQSFHVRLLLRRMFAKPFTERADLTEVAKHRWLSDFADITSDIIQNPISSAYH